jgi:ubiquinone/menaquinone biosynthesis C-methylase UbiE
VHELLNSGNDMSAEAHAQSSIAVALVSHINPLLPSSLPTLQYTMTNPEEPQYDSIAQSYASYDSLPLAKLEHELVTKALGDCTGLTVLDLGGGNGQYARKAIELGAELVDVVDISPAMLEVGIEIEQELGREGKIRWFEADAAKAMHHLPLMPDGYDIVMCNWLFDHAESDEVSPE